MYEDAHLEAAYEDANGGSVDTAVEIDEDEEDHDCDVSCDCQDDYDRWNDR